MAADGKERWSREAGSRGRGSRGRKSRRWRSGRKRFTVWKELSSAWSVPVY